MGFLNFSSWDIRQKVALTVGVVLATSALAVGLPAWQLWQRHTTAEVINKAGRMRMLSQRIVKNTLLLQHGGEGIVRERIQRSRSRAVQVLGGLMGTANRAEDSEAYARLEDVNSRWNRLVTIVDDYKRAVEAGQTKTARELTKPLIVAGDSVLVEADRAVTALQRQAEASVSRAVLLSLGLLLGQSALGALLLWGLIQTLAPLADLKQAAIQMTDGNAFVAVDVERTDEVGRLAVAFNEMARRVRAHQEALEETKSHYEQTFEQAPYAIVLTRANGCVVEMNERARELFRVSREGIEELHVGDHYADESRRDEFLATMRREGQVEDFEARLKRTDGTTFSAVMSSTRRPGEDEAFFETVVKDISARKEAEYKWRVFEQAVDQAGDMIFITDTKGTIWYANSATQDITGYEWEEIIGEDPSLFKSGETPEETYDELWSTIKQGDVFRGTITDRRKDGSLVQLEQTLTPIEDERGHILHFVSTGRDVTDRVERETQMEVLNRMLRHDIDNATTHVLAYADLLGDDLDDDTREEYRTAIHLAGLQIKRLTESARVYMQAVVTDEFETQEINLAKLLKEQLHEADLIYGGLDVVETEFPSGSVRVEGTQMLSTVVGNLLHNAVQHSQKDTVRVSVCLDRNSNGRVLMRVADDGPGVPDDKKDLIFGKGEKKGPGSGTGIGLYLAREVVEQCGGDIWVEDNDPTGAIFVVQLPLAEERVPAVECVSS